MVYSLGHPLSRQGLNFPLIFPTAKEAAVAGAAMPPAGQTGYHRPDCPLQIVAWSPEV